VRNRSLAVALHRWFVRGLAVALPLVGTSTAQAQDRPTLSGTWSASAITESWSIGDWGEACGPRPAPHGAGGGSVTVSESGGELVFSGGGYPRTNGCFEMGGGIGVTSHSASPRSWRTRCGTSAGDPRKATIVTTLGATDSSISFDETGQYQFILKEQNCTASVRRTRSYSLVKRLGDDPPPATTAPAAAATPTVTETARAPEPDRPSPPDKVCTSPGDPARIELRPTRKIMKPGETFSPRAGLFDESGCRVNLLPVWSVVNQDGSKLGEAFAGKVTVSPTGAVTVAADAPDGELAVLAGVNGKSTKMALEIASPERYATLLAAGGVNARGENDEVAVVVVATGKVGSSAVTASDNSTQRKALFAGVVGVFVLGLGAVGLFFLRRTRPQIEEVEEIIPGQTTVKVVQKKRLVAKVSGGAVLYCPGCLRGYSEGATFCATDGVKLLRREGAPPPGAPTPGPPAGEGGVDPRGARICPACGTRYDINARFCGKEGATLVLSPTASVGDNKP
jgi:hypothetical protein